MLTALASGALLTVVMGAVLAVPAVGLASVAQGFDATDVLVPGTLVSLDPAKPNAVVPANNDRTDNLLGVVVSGQEALLNISTGGTKVQVATGGTEAAVVTNAEGDIKTGDSITTSFVTGVGAKAKKATRVVGTAQADFNDKVPGATKRAVVQDGKQREITIGQIPVAINVAFFGGDGSGDSFVPEFIQKLSASVGGHEVSATRILIGGAVLLAALLSVTVLLYAAVRSSIISIGRNPLSQSAVRKSLLQVLLAAVAIIAVALGAIYLLFST